MEEAEQSRYISQLKAEFDSCDTTATGFLDQEELTALCRKLHLDAQLPLLLDALLGGRTYARVTFEEFKDAFVDVLSRSLDFSTSEDDSSYLEPAVPEEVKPKFVKGTKRYGRRSRPDSKPDAPPTCDSEDSMPSRAEATDSSPAGVRKAKLRRSTSLESVESLKSDEETGSHRDQSQVPFQNKGAAEEVGLRTGGDVLTAVCDHTPPAAGQSHDLWRCDRPLRQTLDLDSRIGIRDLHRVLRGSAPISCSTPKRSADLQRAPHMSQAVLEERSLRSTSPSPLTATVGPRVLSLLDDGSGFCSPDKVIALWTEEGIRNSRDILQTLDFSLEDRLSLVDLTLALDNELLVGGSGIHQAALISYKHEIQHLQAVAEQASSERDKVKADLDLADHRNLQLVREVDDRHASMETLNQSRIRDLEQGFRDRLTALRSEAEQESEAALQQVERERNTLLDELQLLRAKQAELQEELCSSTEENRRLEEELGAVKLKLTEAQGSVIRLQTDLDQLLLDKFGSLYPAAAALSPEERFSELVKDYELQCRELRDRNDELSSELDLLKNQKSARKSRRRVGDDGVVALSWTQHQADSDTDESPVRKKLQPTDKSALCSLDVSDPDASSPAFSGPDVSSPAFSGPGVSGPAFSGPDVSGPAFSGPTVSIQTELALEQLQQKHEQELQQLHVQLETQVNYYERSLEVMRQSMEVERKDICQAFKLEISELEEQKAEAEQQVKQLTEALEKLQAQLRRGGGGGWSTEQERRMHWERAELEQNFAREISNLVQRLSAEKDQLEAELRLKMDQEVALVRTQLDQVRSENGALQERLGLLDQQVKDLEDDVAKKRRRLEELDRDHERSREEEERLHRENSRYREEVLDLSSRNLQLSNDNAELSARLRGDQESIGMLRERLATVSKEQEEGSASVRRLQEETLQQQMVWMQEKQLLLKEVQTCKEKLSRLTELEEELSSTSLKLQWVEDDKKKVQGEAQDHRDKVEKLQQSILSLELEAELLRSQLQAVSQDKLCHAQEVTSLQRKLQVAQKTVEELETSVRRLVEEKEELGRSLQEQEGQASMVLQEETCRLRLQIQELQQKLQELQVQSQEQHSLRIQLTQAQDQAARSEAALSLVQAQHVRRLQELQEQTGGACREQLEEAQRRSQLLEEELRLQLQKSSSQISLKQEQFQKSVAVLQQRVEELEIKLKGVRLVLQDKVQELKQQLVQNSKSGALLKDLYLENAQLMAALQVTEQRQKNAEKKNFLLEGKVAALKKLLKEVVMATLAA